MLRKTVPERKKERKKWIDSIQKDLKYTGMPWKRRNTSLSTEMASVCGLMCLRHAWDEVDELRSCHCGPNIIQIV